MEEKERTMRLGTLKEQLTREESNLQRLNQSVNQTQVNIISLRTLIDEYSNKRWEVKDDKKD